MNKIKYFIILMMFGVLASSCDQNEFLIETPKDFLSPENSFTNKEGFQAAVNNLDDHIRKIFLFDGGDSPMQFNQLGLDADIMVGKIGPNNSFTEYIAWNTFNADNGTVKKWWSNYYKMIFNANVIIGRAEEPIVKWTSEAEKNAIVGAARFYRAFAYHFLVNMWGDVPLVLEETSGPKFDYTRAPKAEVYKLCKEDLEFAAQWLPDVDKVKGGQVSKEAANHLLSEVLICTGDYQGAINAASAVINNPNMALMTQRFGGYKNFTFRGYDFTGPYEPWGDVYWDLFREGNFNRREGNKECIWNMQVEREGVVGGLGGVRMERWLAPIDWNLKDKEGISNFLMDTLMGRPVGTGNATAYFDSIVWRYKGDFNKDIRNSIYNVERVHYWRNPSSQYYGQPITPDNLGVPSDFCPATVGPYFKKVASAVHKSHMGQDAVSKQWHDNGQIFKDWYLMRLAETYLLRAEANLRKGAYQAAADDINAVRNRAQATPVTAGDVESLGIDLILDERVRELHLEEFRYNTLFRTGKFVEYLKKYNAVVINKGYSIDNHLNLLPIPNSEIEANKDAELVQNPGYE